MTVYYKSDKGVLFQGDCLEVMRLIPDKSIDAIICDLPYGTTACSWDSLIPFDKLWEQYERIIKDNGAIVLTACQPFTTKLINSNLSMFRYCWYWHKTYSTGFMNANKMPLRNVEEVCVFYKNLPVYNPQGVLSINKKQFRRKDKATTIYSNMGLNSGEYIQKYTNYPTQILKFGKEPKTEHLTQKPLKLMEYLVSTYTNPNMVVLDNTCGSGTTLLACENFNRRWIGIEMNPEYCSLIKKRLTNKIGVYK